MTITVSNRLYGDVGAPVSNATLAASAEVGTLTATNPGNRAVYDDAYMLHGLSTVRISSGHHRGATAYGTPAITADLPTAPWALRWYAWLPATQSAGYGNNEVRQVLRFDGGDALVYYETSAGNAYARRGRADLAVPLEAPVNSGSPMPIAGPLRWEAACDGTDLEVRVYHGQDTAVYRGMTWAGWAPSGPVSWTGYRYRVRPTLRLGAQGEDVAELQRELIDLGYDLGVWGADGDYGGATRAAVMAFQSDYGLTPVDGEAGPETRAAIDLALGRVPDPLWISHVAVADTATWIGPADPPPPPPADMTRLTIGMPI